MYLIHKENKSFITTYLKRTCKNYFKHFYFLLGLDASFGIIVYK